jgi:hypothetical protein
MSQTEHLHKKTNSEGAMLHLDVRAQKLKMCSVFELAFLVGLSPNAWDPSMSGALSFVLSKPC